METVEWVFRHAGNCLIEVPPLELPTAARTGRRWSAWVATLWPDATSHNGWTALAWSKADRGWELPRHLAVGDVLEFGLAAVSAADGTAVAGWELRWYGWLPTRTDLALVVEGPLPARPGGRRRRRRQRSPRCGSRSSRASASIPAGCPTSSATTSSTER